MLPHAGRSRAAGDLDEAIEPDEDRVPDRLDRGRVSIRSASLKSLRIPLFIVDNWLPLSGSRGQIRLDGWRALWDAGARTVPLLLERVVIRAETRLTSSVVGALADAGCSAVVLSGRQGKRLAVISGRAHNDAALRMAQYSAVGDPLWRLEWTRRFIGAKLARQQRFLERALDLRVDRRKPISDTRNVDAVRTRISEDELSLDSLRGWKGRLRRHISSLLFSVR